MATTPDDWDELAKSTAQAMRDLIEAHARLAPVLCNAAEALDDAYESLLQVWMACAQELNRTGQTDLTDARFRGLMGVGSSSSVRSRRR